jgi:hypothetical protein
MADRIVYCVVTKPGGVDGRDSQDKGGFVKYASYVKSDAEKKVDSWSSVEARVFDPDEIAKKALGKLDAL